MSAKYIPLSEPVAEFLDQHEKSGIDKDRVWVLAYRALEYMHYNISAEPKTLRIPVEPNKTVLFPSDCVQWSKVGILNGNGEFCTLVVNRSLTTLNACNSNRLSALSADVPSETISNLFINYWNGYGYETLYGIGYGVQNFGEFRVDEQNGIIVLSPSFGYDSVLFEYISCPEKDYDYKIDRRLREAVISFIGWKLKLNSRDDFMSDYIDADRKINPFNIQTFQQIIREQNKFTLKI